MAQAPGRPAAAAAAAAAAAPAVNRAYNFAATWEKNAPLSEDQQAAVAALGLAVSDRPLPLHIAKEDVHAQTGVETSTQPSLSALTEVVLLNSHQFYKWFADLESAMKSETDEKYRHYVDNLTGKLGTCNSILNQLDGTLLLFDELQMHHEAVTTKTKTLHDACERLVLEKNRLVEFADTLRSKLKYFDELETIATHFYSPSMTAANEQFLPLLKRLDDCILFVTNNPQYADSSVYLFKFKQLQVRALGLMRSHVQTVLKSTSSQVQAAVKESVINGKSTMSDVGTYVRFKTAASELKALMEELESRRNLPEYLQVLSDCHTLYCEMRLPLVQGVAQQRIAEYARKEPLPSFSRLGCAYLLQVCQLEYQLFQHFFPSSSSEASSLSLLTDPLCTLLYDALRPKFIHETSLDLLCELVDILILEEEIGRRGEPASALRPTILRVLADIQERLTFRVQTYIRNEVVNYLPTTEDLDYPGKLENIQPEELEENDVHSTLYPPLEKTIACLKKLYRRVETEIFTGLAQEAVGNCAASIQRASKLLLRKSSEMDSQLFLIKHLLVLREQIAPFDIDFAATHKELDFGHVLEHLRQIMIGRASLFDLTSRTTLARTLSPRVLESQIDAKKELEKSLKTTCEQFIMSVTKIAVEPMLSFITKVTAFRVAFSGQSDKALSEQAFATQEKAFEMASKVEKLLNVELPSVAAKMKLYLQNPTNRSILFKPIKSNILEAHGQVLTIVHGEYPPEVAQGIPLMSQSHLQTYLDNLC